MGFLNEKLIQYGKLVFKGKYQISDEKCFNMVVKKGAGARHLV